MVKMKNAMRLFVVALVYLTWTNGVVVPNGGYCTENQCFTVFQDLSDFTTAQAKCESLDGHLMTVRSSVSHDILVILLGNNTGHFWIGLHLPVGCPDAATELKGFQWVTKDSSSDFSAWAPGFVSSCSSSRCVSVSKASDFKWTQVPCNEPADGFLCEHSFGETCLRLSDIAQPVKYITPLGFGAGELLSMPHGSVAILKSPVSKYICDSGQWRQGPWSCEIENGGCEHKCAMDNKQGPSCSCPPGKTVNSSNKITCETAKDDPCLLLQCDYSCQHNGEQHVCVCGRGFQLGEDNRSCHDLDECADRRQCPSENFKCVNTLGGFQCVCSHGYKMIGRRCIDEDECESAPCEHKCVNTPGGYRCTCSPGYIPDPNAPNTCQLHCGADECPAECDPNDESQCNCPTGYISEERDEGVICLDIDECDSEQCDHGCENTFGSYKCTCRPGFKLVGEFRCVESADRTDSGGGSGLGTPTTPFVPPPEPTKKPSAVSVGGLVGIILCSVFFILLVVFLVHHIFNRREKTQSAGALKAPEGETHGLERVATDK